IHKLILIIRITLFPKSGFSIGIITNHVVSDAKTSTMFFKSWASICSTLYNTNNKNLPTLSSELTPCFDRTFATDPNGLHTLYVKSFEIFVTNPKEVISDDVVYATFELTRIDIEKVRRRVVATSSSTPRRLTTFMLAFSLVSTCILLYGVFSMAESRNGDGGVELGIALPPQAMDKFCSIFSETVISDDVVYATFELTRIDIEKVRRRVVATSSSTPRRLTTFMLAFSLVSTCILLYGVFSMAESRNGDGGVELGIALPPQAMDKFCSIFSETVKSYVD
ncbi:malonyl-CoA:anthocyanidin 5-O-glucoside-6''-O-malonyltransferase-like, partial [Cucurbita pepo subsp. pepo]|uniref:malonyl-CoA:anthocyanidin 5-O-glucoside-6''-O-malonyltransferase-like n=1 Tax=Cucurbita pepo subsp. pepo TaxID=3664 RepID=UPI000C9D3CFD